jgi:hypothetical protein
MCLVKGGSYCIFYTGHVHPRILMYMYMPLAVWIRVKNIHSVKPRKVISMEIKKKNLQKCEIIFFTFSRLTSCKLCYFPFEMSFDISEKHLISHVSTGLECVYCISILCPMLNSYPTLQRPLLQPALPLPRYLYCKLAVNWQAADQ